MLGFLNFLRSEYKPSPGEFLPIDMAGLVKKLEIRERGSDRGARGIPSSNSGNLDEIESEIVEAIRTLALSEEKRTNDQIALYQTRLQAADPTGAASEMRAVARQSVAEFEAEAAAATSELERARIDVVEHRLALNDFRKSNGLTRPARAPGNHVLMAGILAVLFLLETGPNAVMFGAGDELGILGGYAIAIVFSVLNLGCGFSAGYFGWTNSIHVRVWRKIAGSALAVALLALVVFINCLVAHLREKVNEGMPTNEAGRAAWVTMFQHPFSIHDSFSAGLAGVGVLFAIAAMIEGYRWTDSYPGYWARTRSLQSAEERWGRSLEERLTILDEVQKRRASELRALRANLRDRRAEIPEILASSARLTRNFGSHIQHMEGVGRYALAAYRDSNRAARPSASPAPAHFDQLWSLDGVRAPQIQPIASPVSQADWQSANTALEEGMDKLQNAFQSAVTAMKAFPEKHMGTQEPGDVPLAGIVADGRAAYQ